MNRWTTAGALLAVGIALGLRCPRLDQRPMHNDEGVNAVKFGELWTHGSYKYDPDEYHGPSLPYATLLINRLAGGPAYRDFTEGRLRIVTVFFGAGLILLLPLLADGSGRKAAFWAALFAAVSPATVYYSRYYIHEMLLLFFTALALASGWRYWRTRKLRWVLLCGASVGLMQATKETFVLTLVACAIALGLNQFWNRKLDATVKPEKLPCLNWRHLLAGFGLWVVVAVLLFSSFFSNPKGLPDSIGTYSHWLSRAGGNSAHIHGPFFYIHRLFWFHSDKGPIWSEALIMVLALVGATAGFARKWLADGNASFVRFMTLYTIVLTAIYSVLSYKTPWCLLSFWLGFILLAGVGAAVLVNASTIKSLRLAITLALLGGIVQLGAQGWRASVEYAADQRNPYVYGHTSPDVLELVQKVESLANVAPDGHTTVVKVVAPEDDYWPLPWYLRRFDHSGWYGKLPEDPYAPVMIVSAQLHANLDEKKTHLMAGLYKLRPTVFFELYVETGLWTRYLEAQSKGAH